MFISVLTEVFFKALPIELHHHSDRMHQGPTFWPIFRRTDKYNAEGRQIRWLPCPNGWSYNCECDTQHWLRKQNLNDLIFLHQILPWAHRSGNTVCTKLFTVCRLSLSLFFIRAIYKKTHNGFRWAGLKMKYFVTVSSHKPLWMCTAVFTHPSQQPCLLP